MSTFSVRSLQTLAITYWELEWGWGEAIWHGLAVTVSFHDFLSSK